MKKAQWENWLNLLMGIWLFLTPWVITRDLSPTASGAADWNAWIVGIIVAFSAGLALQELKPWEEWVNLIVGVWLIFSPWLVGYYHASGLAWNSVLIGLAITIFSGIAIPIAYNQQHPQY